MTAIFSLPNWESAWFAVQLGVCKFLAIWFGDPRSRMNQGLNQCYYVHIHEPSVLSYVSAPRREEIPGNLISSTDLLQGWRLRSSCSQKCVLLVCKVWRSHLDFPWSSFNGGVGGVGQFPKGLPVSAIKVIIHVHIGWCYYGVMVPRWYLEHVVFLAALRMGWSSWCQDFCIETCRCDFNMRNPRFVNNNFTSHVPSKPSKPSKPLDLGIWHFIGPSKNCNQRVASQGSLDWHGVTCGV